MIYANTLKHISHIHRTKFTINIQRIISLNLWRCGTRRPRGCGSAWSGSFGSPIHAEDGRVSNLTEYRPRRISRAGCRPRETGTLDPPRPVAWVLGLHHMHQHHHPHRRLHYVSPKFRRGGGGDDDFFRYP